MPKPIALCLEYLNADDTDERYMCCVAVRGGVPGLALSNSGAVRWCSEESLAAELWVTADERLALLRPNETTRLLVHRETRSLEVPTGKPVILLDGDELEVGSTRLRLHVHGETEEVSPPEPLTTRSRWAVAPLAAAAAVGALAGACNRNPPIDVRDMPPIIAIPEDASPSVVGDAEADSKDPQPATSSEPQQPAATPIPPANAAPSTSSTPNAPDGGRAGTRHPKSPGSSNKPIEIIPHPPRLVRPKGGE